MTGVVYWVLSISKLLCPGILAGDKSSTLYSRFGGTDKVENGKLKENS
jgi:hypothetical protein